MKNQQVSVDYWAIGKAMLMYITMSAMGWLILRFFNMVIMFPRRMRSQQESLQNSLSELQRRFPAMNITEQDLKDAEKELDEYLKEEEQKEQEIANNLEVAKQEEDSKKTK